MTTIYLATTGCYSDYGIVRIFTDRALAEQYRDERNTVASEIFPDDKLGLVSYRGGIQIEEWTTTDDQAAWAQELLRGRLVGRLDLRPEQESRGD